MSENQQSQESTKPPDGKTDSDQSKGSQINSNFQQGLHIHQQTESPIIRDVWEDNFEEEIMNLMELVEKYKIVAMDTEFPGIVYKISQNELSNPAEIEYRSIKRNVDNLKVIQVGVSIADENGMLPNGVTTWQFNFKFDLKKDQIAQDSKELLESSGIKFDVHAQKGINPQTFGEYLISSGIAFNEDIKWITYHGGSDFGYLLKLVDGQLLPDNGDLFYDKLKIYFPQYYDIKYLIKDTDQLKSGGLSKLAYDLSVKRIGPQHQAGSDALLTLSTYFKLKESYLKNTNEAKYLNILYGIGSGCFEAPSDYVWMNYVDNSSPMMYPGNYMSNGMNGPYYGGHSEGMYDHMMGSGYSMNYNMGYFANNMNFIDPNSKGYKM